MVTMGMESRLQDHNNYNIKTTEIQCENLFVLFLHYSSTWFQKNV